MAVNTLRRTIFAPSGRPGVIVVGSERPIVPTLPTLAAVLTEEERRARLAYWIRDIRFRRGYTPPKLADLVGVTRSTVNKWESGDQVPSMIWLGPLAAALRVDPRLFADLPPIPPNAVADYLVEESIQSGMAEGRRRAEVPEDRDTPAPSPQRRPRAAEAARER